MISKDSFNKFRPQVSVPVVTSLAAFFIATFDNRTLWTSLVAALGLDSIHHWLFLGLAWLILFLALNILFTLLAFRLTLKPFLCLMFLIAAGVSYFTDSFGTIIDKTMIYNALETDTHEALELMTWPLARHLLLYGLLPIILLLLSRVRYRSFAAGVDDPVSRDFGQPYPGCRSGVFQLQGPGPVRSGEPGPAYAR